MFDIKRVNQKVVEGLPSLVQWGHKRVPVSLQTTLLNMALNRFFAPELAQQKLSFMKGKRIAISISDYALSFTIELRQQRLVANFMDTQADVTLRANSQDMLAMINNQVDPDSLFFRRRLSILGDTELGLFCKNLLDSIGAERFPAPIASLLQWMGEPHADPHAQTKVV